MKNKRVIYNLILSITIIIFLVASIIITIKYMKDNKIKENEIVINKEISNYVEPKEEEQIVVYIRNLREEYDNDDVVGIIKIEALDIYLPLLQTTNNKYYLNHLINKKYGYSTIFVDYRTNINDAKQINIYGHNSNKYDLPFKKLLKYLDKNFYKGNEYIELQTEKGITSYKIFSVEIAKDKYEHEKILFNSSNKWNKHFNILKNNSTYDTNVLVNGEDSIVVLQTCLQRELKGSLLVISARKVESENL